MALYKFEQICTDLQVEMKKRNTIVDMWPTQLKLQEGQDGAHRLQGEELFHGFMYFPSVEQR